MLHSIVPATLTLILGTAASASVASPGSPHSFVLTYRDFGPVKTSSGFHPAIGYALRPEGCYAKHSDEAICGFTLRADQALTVTNLQNLAHGSAADGSMMRTCCLFIQGDNRGYPITRAAGASSGVGVVRDVLRPGEQVGIMLRVPNYRAASPLAAITFSRGQGDEGLSFAEHVVELP